MSEEEFVEVIDDLMALYNKCYQRWNEELYPGIADDPLEPEEEEAIAALTAQVDANKIEARKSANKRSFKIEIQIEDIPCFLPLPDARSHISAYLKNMQDMIMDKATDEWRKDRNSYIKEVLLIENDYLERTINFVQEGRGKKTSYKSIKRKINRWNECLKVYDLDSKKLSNKEIALEMGWLPKTGKAASIIKENNSITKVTEYLNDAIRLIQSVKQNTFPQA